MRGFKLNAEVAARHPDAVDAPNALSDAYAEVVASVVFLNLIINAAHALPVAGGHGEIRVLTRTDASGHAIIEVHDTGRGLSSAALRHVFEPFYTTKAPGLGTGWGLTICHDIVVALGGRIEVTSTERRGSVFRVVLPPAALAA